MFSPLKTVALAASIALSPLAALASGFGPLISASDLADAISGNAPLILDIRQGTLADKKTPVFEGGHIPGAVSAPYALFRGPKENPGQVVAEEKLQEVLRSLGVEKNRPVVIVHQGKNASDFGSSARVYWTLKSSGVSDLSILNGGVNAWKEAGLTLEEGAGAAVTPSAIEVSFSEQWLATTDDVKSIVDGGEKVDLVDARPEAFWNGDKQHPAALKPGTLPQSRYFFQARWFGEQDTGVLNASVIPGLIEEGGFKNDEPLVSFCNTGHWAATNWFVLSELGGLDDVRLYAGSMVEYSHAGGKMLNAPGLVENLINKVTGN